MNEKILIIDDEDDIRLLIKGLLEDEGYQVMGAGNSEQAYEIIEQDTPDLIIQDIWLQGSDDDGIDILKSVKKSYPDLPFLMISGHGTIETAVSAIKIGAYDFIEKPFKSDRLLLMIQRALENANLKQQNTQLKQIASQHNKSISSQLPDNIRQTLDKVARTNSRVLITGETGTGKNISAQYIHENSERSNMPFMTLNCANNNLEKLEIELFGSANNVAGLLELVNGGTLLLDEVASLPADMQGKLLHLLQESSYFKVGSNNKIPVDIRVISTTSKNIVDEIKQGNFREDLYYRLNVVPVDMLPLRKRRSDIIELISNYSNNNFSKNAMAKLQAYSWPGNIRQLHNVLDWVSIMNDEQNIIEIEDLPPELSGKVQDIKNAKDSDVFDCDIVLQMGLREAREAFERYYLLSQVNKFDGNISKTSEFIGMERSALHRKLKSLEVFSEDKQNVA